jgi:hypothetical protein
MILSGCQNAVEGQPAASSLIFDVSVLIGNFKGKAATLQKWIQRGLLADRREERLNPEIATILLSKPRTLSTESLVSDHVRWMSPAFSCRMVKDH